MIRKNLKIYTCLECKKDFTRDDAEKVCSNCFACTGCEMYICPHCGHENIFKEMKKPNWDNLK